MEWLLISNGYDIPTYHTSFIYYNYVKPLFNLCGYPYRLKCNYDLPIVQDFLELNLTQEINPDDLAKIIQKEKIELIFEIYNNTPNTAIAQYIDENRGSKVPIFGLNVGDNISNVPQYFDEHWQLNKDIPIALFTPHYPYQNLEKKYDITYVGSQTPEKARVLMEIKQSGFNLNLWGSGWERYSQLRDLAQGYLPHREYVKTVAKSKILLNFNHSSSKQSLELGALKAFQLDGYGENLIEKIEFYLNNEPERRKWIEESESRFGDVSNEHFFIDVEEKIKKYIPLFTVDNVRYPDFKYNEDKVTVICHVYNGEKYLEQMIISVLGQSYKNIELYILDDGSTDGTAAIVAKYLQDKRLSYEYQNNMGGGLDAFDLLAEKCMSRVNAKYVIHIGGDDILYPNRVLDGLKIFETYPDVEICYGNAKNIRDAGAVCGSSIGLPEEFRKDFPTEEMPRTLISGTFINQPSVMLKSSTVHELGGFQTPFSADLFFWNSVAGYSPYKYSDAPCVLYRHHEKGSSTGVLESSQEKRAHSTANVVSMLKYLRYRSGILRYYPEIRSANSKNELLYQAYIDLSIRATHYIFVPEIVYVNAKCAHDINPYGLEAMNHLLLAYKFAGLNSMVDRLLSFIHQNIDVLKSQNRFDYFISIVEKIVSTPQEETSTYQFYSYIMRLEEDADLFSIIR